MRPEILKQGRVTYFDGSILNHDSEEDDKSDVSLDDGNETQAISKEVPIPLFASCSGDRKISEEMAAWTIRSSDIDEKLLLAQSHVWPGSFVFVKDRICDSIYIGYGHKYSSRNYAPSAIPLIANEYPLGPDVTETADPSIEKEDIFAKNGEIEAEISLNGDDENMSQ